VKPEENISPQAGSTKNTEKRFVINMFKKSWVALSLGGEIQ